MLALISRTDININIISSGISLGFRQFCDIPAIPGNNSFGNELADALILSPITSILNPLFL